MTMTEQPKYRTVTLTGRPPVRTQPMDIRERLDLHAKACREALAAGMMRPKLSDEVEGHLAGANLTRGNLSGANLSGASLSGANLAYADLGGANLTEVGLRGAHLAEVNLAGANLTNASLRGACLLGANLTGADLTGADVVGADFSEACVEGALFGDYVLTIGEVRSIRGGRGGRHAFTARCKAGRLLQYGHEVHTVEEWRQDQHTFRSKFETEITALLAYCDALDAIDAMGGSAFRDGARGAVGMVPAAEG